MEPKYKAEEVIGHPFMILWEYDWMPKNQKERLTLLRTDMSPWEGTFEVDFPNYLRWDMLVPRRVSLNHHFSFLVQTRYL